MVVSVGFVIVLQGRGSLFLLAYVMVVVLTAIVRWRGCFSRDAGNRTQST